MASMSAWAAPLPRDSTGVATPAMPSMGTLLPPNHWPMGIVRRAASMRPALRSTRTLSNPPLRSHGSHSATGNPNDHAMTGATSGSSSSRKGEVSQVTPKRLPEELGERLVEAVDDELHRDGGEDEPHDAPDHVDARLAEDARDERRRLEHQERDEAHGEDREVRPDALGEALGLAHEDHDRRDGAGAGEERESHGDGADV